MSVEAQGFHILHIEDDPIHRDLIAMVLSERGIHVTSTATLECARARLCKEEFDLIILDGNVPERPGVSCVSTVSFYIEYLRGRYPVVAATCSPWIEQELVLLGCIPSEKHAVWKVVIQVLDTMIATSS